MLYSVHLAAFVICGSDYSHESRVTISVLDRGSTVYDFLSQTLYQSTNGGGGVNILYMKMIIVWIYLYNDCILEGWLIRLTRYIM